MAQRAARSEARGCASAVPGAHLAGVGDCVAGVASTISPREIWHLESSLTARHFRNIPFRITHLLSHRPLRRTQSHFAEEPMSQRLSFTLIFTVVLVAAISIVEFSAAPTIPSVQAQTPAMQTPADGYTVHVTAPHVVNGKVMGPFHHYC